MATGPTVGAAMRAHPGIDMMSFTGSTRAGIDVAQNAAPTVKRVALELGGKSPNIILDDADFEKAVTGGITHCFNELRPVLQRADAHAGAARAHDGGRRASPPRCREDVKVGDPRDAATTHRAAVVNRTQLEKIQALIEKGIDEGATLAAGGPGRPEGLNRGYLRAAHRVRATSTTT